MFIAGCSQAPTLCIGTAVDIMHGRRKAPFDTYMFLEDLKKNDVHFGCTWFEQRSDVSPLLGSIRDLNRKLIESESSSELGNTFVFADPS